MPIRPENRGRYPKDWKAISLSVREAAGWKCEVCAAPNGQTIARSVGGASYMLEHGQVYDAATGEFLGFARGSEYPVDRFVKVVLTVAHLDHTPENCERENLKAMCQRCHLTYDAQHHARNASQTRRSRLASGDLFSPPPEA